MSFVYSIVVGPKIDDTRDLCAQVKEVTDRLEAYLYSHTQIITSSFNARFVFVVSTHAPTPNEVDYLADYQIGRLRSGLWGARVMHGCSLAEAIAAANKEAEV